MDGSIRALKVFMTLMCLSACSGTSDARSSDVAAQTMSGQRERREGSPDDALQPGQLKAVFGGQSEFDQKMVEAIGCRDPEAAGFAKDDRFTFRVERVSVEGGCDERVVEDVASARSAVFQCCYEGEGGAKPTHDSRVYAKWSVGDDGVMSVLSMGPSYADARPLYYCTRDLLDPVNFGEAGATCEVEATFTYVQGQSE